jgi:pimeloyl-ACP methyl ester carboxylesterase
VDVITRDEAAATRGSPKIRRGWLIAWGLVVPLVTAVLTAQVMPRGPVHPTDVIVSMLIGAGVGVVSGLMLGRWATVIAPLLFALGFELGRTALDAPSLDGIHLGSTLGIVLFVTGRGFHALVVFVPMIWGGFIGAVASRNRARDGRFLGAVPKVSTGLLAALILGVGVFVARPAYTDPILSDDGLPLRGSIAELAWPDLGGHEQSVMIRGNDVSLPVLLYLTGGPGNSDLGYTRTFLEALEADFVVVAWDQRGVGKSYRALDPTETLTLESAVADVIELTEYLADRFDQRKIYLFGNSWGSIIGVLAAQARPDLYHAYVGAGQMVNPLATDRILYQQMLDFASASGDQQLLDRMKAYGQPPYDNIYAYMTVIEHYGDLEPYRETAEFAAGVPGIQGTGVSEYAFMDKLNVFRGLADMGGHLYPQAQAIDLRRDVSVLEVPVYLVQGAHELSARAILAEEYASSLQAPSVKVAVFENSGHVPHFEEAARFHSYLVDVVLAETSN